MVRRLVFPDRKTAGSMKTTTKLVLLELLAGTFGFACVGAAVASVYFLYEVFAKVTPWFYVVWSFGAGLVAMLIVAVLNGWKHRVDYVDQLIERGYSTGEAMEAWRTADGGGLNLLRNLQQVELSEQIDRLEKETDTPSQDTDSA